MVGKLTQGAADAGFVYATDVVAAGDKLKTIELPDDLQPEVRYGAAVVERRDRSPRPRRSSSTACWRATA